MKYTLLEMTQQILRSMESDDVNGIGDTGESMDVAHIIKECYFEIISDIQFPEHEAPFQFEASLDNTKPCVMYLPDRIQSLGAVSYNQNTKEDPDYQPISYVPFAEFMQRTNELAIADTTVGSMEIELDGNTFYFKFHNDRFPTIWTSPDDNTVLMNAYDSSVDDTLNKSKTMVFGSQIPLFTLEDTFIPKLDPRQFQLLLNSAKSQAHIELKQSANPKSEKKERRHRILANKTKHLTEQRKQIQIQKGYGR